MRVASCALTFGAVLVAGAIAIGDAYARADRVDARPRAVNSGQVYFISGLMGEALSPGFESLADKLRQRGIAVTAHRHTGADSIAEQAKTNYHAGNHGPIIVVGHSLGAEAAFDVARKLNDNKIPVRLIISLGPTADLEPPANVSSVVNYYQSNGMSRGRVTRAAGFHGSLTNVDLVRSAEVNHFSMVQAAQFHEQTIAHIVSLVGGRRKPLEPARPPSTEVFWGRVDHGVQ